MKKPQIIFRIPKALYMAVVKDLTRQHSFASERIGFIATKHKVLETGSIIIFATSYYPIRDEFYIDDPSVGARINSDAIREAMQIIIDKNVGLFHVHLHSLSLFIPEFSSIDMQDNPKIVKSFGYTDDSQVHGMVVLGTNGLNSQIQLPGSGELVPATKNVIVGYPMIISTHKILKRKPISKRYERQSFLGKFSESLISQVVVGIVGLGGGGSHIVQQLAYLGFKNYVLFDYDIVAETNLNRMIGAGIKDVRKTKKVNIAEMLIQNLHNDAKINKVDSDWKHNPAFLQECDIVIGCVDSFRGRRDIESECRRYLIPYIDIGMDVHHKHKQEPPSLGGQIILSMPGEICMTCMGFLDKKNLAMEAGKYGDAGGKPQVVWSNGVLASQAIGIVVNLITKWTGLSNIIKYYSFNGNTGVLSKHPRLEYINELCTHFSLEDVGNPSYKDL